MGEIKFGTDGWRAVISDTFTFKNVEIVSQAIADFINSQKEDIYRKKEVAVGYDTRFLSEKYALTVSGILAANGIKVTISDRPCPTPALSYYVKINSMSGGIMITASHNPPEYNGIKYKGYFGGSASEDIISLIESHLYKNEVKRHKDFSGLEKRIERKNIVKYQLDFIKKYVDMKLLKRAKLRVLIDSMNGSGLKYLGDILKATDIRVDYVNTEINPGFKGRAPEPNEKHLEETIKIVKKCKYDLGVATDGDADRVGIIDSTGHMLTGHKVMALLLLHLLINRKMRGAVVQTICSTGLINKISDEFGIKIYETPVGFKHIGKLMVEKDILIGGEETGGIGFKDYIPERDSFLSALLIVEMMIMMKKSLNGILRWVDKKYGTYVYEREDIVFPGEKRDKLAAGIKEKPLRKVLDKNVISIDSSDGTKFICEDSSWLLLRFSGTEPKLRIYSETSSKKKSLEYLKVGKKYAMSLY